MHLPRATKGDFLARKSCTWVVSTSKEILGGKRKASSAVRKFGKAIAEKNAKVLSREKWRVQEPGNGQCAKPKSASHQNVQGSHGWGRASHDYKNTEVYTRPAPRVIVRLHACVVPIPGSANPLRSSPPRRPRRKAETAQPVDAILRSTGTRDQHKQHLNTQHSIFSAMQPISPTSCSSSPL